MGQTALLCCVDEAHFRLVAAHPESVVVYRVALFREEFVKTFEGLRFVLAKGQPAEQAAWMEQLFEPATYVGEEIDYAQLEWQNLSDDASWEGTAVYYHAPATVGALAALLAGVTDEAFRGAFDADELNREGIYPGWSREGDEDLLLEELHRLQQFFARTSGGGHYCICSVG